MSDSILLVEDDPVLGPSLAQRLALEGFTVSNAESLTQARELLAQRLPDFVLSDIRLPEGSGADLLDDLSERSGSVPVIFMTAFGDLDQAVSLVRRGARDYLAKPFDLDGLIERIKTILVTKPTRDAKTFGLSPAMERIRATLDRLADLDLPVLLVGETGTGKEVAARYLHHARSEQRTPFEAVNCAQISSDLADTVLFGHERGAFTGAFERKAGILETVGSGTLLLDEIGEMSHELQLKMLRVLQERHYRRLGAKADRVFEGRIVAATNRDLDDAVASGQFREDLLYRINVVTLHIPPLRDRAEEIEPLIAHFAKDAALRMRQPVPEISPAAFEAALAHDWPGNIRELRNRIERAVALMQTNWLDASDLFPEITNKPLGKAKARPVEPGAIIPLEQARDAAERAHIITALRTFDGRMRDTADALGISRSTLWERMRRHSIERPTRRP